MRRLWQALMWCAFASAGGQTIVTVAGLPYSHRAAVDSQPALNAPLGNVHTLLLDRITGRLLFDDQTLVNRLEPDGSLVVVAGAGRGQDGSDADGTLASGLKVTGFDGLAQDAAGNLYVSEVFEGRIYRIALDGTVTTFAGGGTLRGSPSDGGLATAATLSSPRGLVFDSQGNLDIAEAFCQCIRRVSPSGVISTVYTLPPSKEFRYFEGLAIDAQDNLYAAEFAGDVVVKIAPDGTTEIVAGTGVAGYSGDGGPAAAAQLSGPSSVTLDANGGMYIADSHNHRVRRIAPDGTISTFAGTGQAGFSGDGGPAMNAQINLPAQTLIDSAGNIYLADFGNSRLRRVSPDGTIATVAGTGLTDPNQILYPRIGDGGPALSAVFNYPGPLVFDSAGNLYVADSGNGRVRKITPDGIVTTIAGNGQPGVSGNGGPAIDTVLSRPSALTMDSHGALFIGTSDSRVFRLGLDNTLTPVAGIGEGTGPVRFQGDGGPAVNAILNGISGIAIDSKGNVFIADEINTRVRKVDTTGIITTVAGPAGQPGVQDFWGGLAIDSHDNLYVGTGHVDSNEVYVLINRVNTDGSLTPVAGNAQLCPPPGVDFAYDGAQATQVPLCEILGLSIDSQDVLYIPEAHYSAILTVSPDGTIRRIAGSRTAVELGDGGPALQADIGAPSGAARDAAGNLFISQVGLNRIRKVMSAPLTAEFSQSRIDWRGSAAQSQTVVVRTSVAEPFPYAVQAQTSDGAPWLAANRVTGQTGDSLTLFVNPSGLATGVYRGAVSVAIPAGPAGVTLPVTLTVP